MNSASQRIKNGKSVKKLEDALEEMGMQGVLPYLQENYQGQRTIKRKLEQFCASQGLLFYRR
ncbi:hypothetical protein M5D96_011563 [Drosophila gunungcola]|uniref:Uncharacterized protein n=1 Tax=Drosophila gunungcola TaxID=103775 RepID=A0A9P9YEW1_9MUSC|nr:hypothetical protein M5D96_011563 [Drosophila gunungcola]